MNEPKTLASIKLTDFEEYLQQTFSLSGSQIEGRIEVTLVEATLAKNAPQNTEARAPFSLLFRAAPETRSDQGMYHLTNDEFGCLENVFLVPIKMDAEGLYLEAIFN